MVERPKNAVFDVFTPRLSFSLSFSFSFKVPVRPVRPPCPSRPKAGWFFWLCF